MEIKYSKNQKTAIYLHIHLDSLFLTFVTEKISRTDDGQPRPKYFFNKCGTNIYFFTLQRFGPSPSPNFKAIYLLFTCKLVIQKKLVNNQNLRKKLFIV